MKNEINEIIASVVAERFTIAKTKLLNFSKAQQVLAVINDKKGKQLIYGMMVLYLLSHPEASENDLLTEMYNKLNNK